VAADARPGAPVTRMPHAPTVAWRPVLAVLVVDATLLAATVTRYGYHRDELYFRLLAGHPAWGYVDQPPFTPMLVKLGIAVSGDNLWALRVPAMLFALAAVTLTAVLTRELGGGRAAQVLAVAGVSGAFVLISGHVLLTATPDLVIWLSVLVFATRAVQREDPRWWIGAGVTAGLGLYNKQLVVVLALALFAGLVIGGPRWQLTSRWLWVGVGVAALIGSPNLVYQATHGWPEATMASAIAAHKGHDDRVFFVPFQLVLLGLTVTPIWVVGLVRLLRDNRFSRVRALGWAYLVGCVLVLATGGQPYYTFGLLASLFAAGCVVTADWAAGRPWRWAWTVAAVCVSGAMAVVLALPVFPVRSLPAAVAYVNQTARDSVGWPMYVAEVADVYRALPAAQQSRTAIITDNYGEAGALARYGLSYRLPPSYSGQNELFNLGPPPTWATSIIVVGLDNAGRYFTGCTRVGHLDNHVGVTNEEQGRPLTVCHGPLAPWPQLWRAFRHYD
jgi:4-amino-4-deoxy-L-arabinose transferase-like glycosyltransferase